MTNALEVTWCVLAAQTQEHGSMRVQTGADIAALIAVLAEPDTGDAIITHLGRPTHLVPALGDQPVPDHVLHASVRGEWGYLSYAGPATGHRDGFAGSPTGDPHSPAIHGTFHTDYPAGSGLPLDVFTAVLTDFLTTAEPSTRITWTPD